MGTTATFAAVDLDDGRAWVMALRDSGSGAFVPAWLTVLRSYYPPPMRLLIPTALARGVDEAELCGIIEQLRPRVEEATGRTFESLPRSAIDDRAHVRAVLVARPPWATAESWDADAAGRRADLVLT